MNNEITLRDFLAMMRGRDEQLLQLNAPIRDKYGWSFPGEYERVFLGLAEETPEQHMERPVKSFRIEVSGLPTVYIG